MKKLNLKIKDMPYAAEEALNRLRVNIKFCGKNTKKIVITSSVPNEGKSTVSVRLWKLLSEGRHRGRTFRLSNYNLSPIVPRNPIHPEADRSVTIY